MDQLGAHTYTSNIYIDTHTTSEKLKKNKDSSSISLIMRSEKLTQKKINNEKLGTDCTG